MVTHQDEVEFIFTKIKDILREHYYQASSHSGDVMYSIRVLSSVNNVP